MKKTRMLLWRIFRRLPYFITSLPYYFSFALLKLFLKSAVPSCEVGYRNSMRYLCLEPFFSDLDITVICDESYRERAMRTFQLAGKLLPFLGELNLYSRSNVEGARALCNPFERDRDPLLATGSLNVANATKADKIVFAFRMLDADWETLRSRPATRQKKWSCHFKCLGFAPLEFYDHSAVLKCILNELGAEAEAARVTRFRDRLAVNKAAPRMEDRTHPLIQALFFNHICYVPASGDLLPLHKEIIAAQARWEHWAAEVIRTPATEEQLVHHLANADRFLLALSK